MSSEIKCCALYLKDIPYSLNCELFLDFYCLEGLEVLFLRGCQIKSTMLRQSHIKFNINATTHVSYEHDTNGLSQFCIINKS